MCIATRIRQVRLDQFLSLEAVAVQAGLSTTVLAKIENGEEIPSLETIDALAAAMGVPVVGLFCSDLNSMLTPWLTPRLSLQQLVEGPFHTHPFPPTLMAEARRFRAGSLGILSIVMTGTQRLLGRTSRSRFRSLNSRKPDVVRASADLNDKKAKQ
jgi:transcriptional regulator with XRE-family HTH domain